MSTNYYYIGPDAERQDHDVTFAGDEAEGMHIGKNSIGWSFMFQAYPDLGLVSWEAWQERLGRGSGQIVDEYGRVVTLDTLRETVEASRPYRANHPSLERRPAYDAAENQREWLDADGWHFTRDYFC